MLDGDGGGILSGSHGHNRDVLPGIWQQFLLLLFKANNGAVPPPPPPEHTMVITLMGHNHRNDNRPRRKCETEANQCFNGLMGSDHYHHRFLQVSVFTSACVSCVCVCLCSCWVCLSSSKRSPQITTDLSNTAK